MNVNEKCVLEMSKQYFNTPTQLASEIFFYAKIVGHYFYDINYSLEDRVHESYLIMFINCGSLQIKSGDFTTIVRENEFAVIDCKIKHSYFTTSKTEVIWLHFDGCESENYYKLLCEGSGSPVPIIKTSSASLYYLNLILNSYRTEKSPYEPQISSFIVNLLTELLLGIKTKETPDMTVITKAILFLESNFKNEISIGKVAREVGLSKFHFTRQFKLKTGQSPYEYLLLLRLNHSKILLKTTDKKIHEIALLCGFNSEVAFIQAFKAHNKLTPTNFRLLEI